MNTRACANLTLIENAKMDAITYIWLCKQKQSTLYMYNRSRPQVYPCVIPHCILEPDYIGL